jgi:cysteine-rich repeat protein
LSSATLLAACGDSGTGGAGGGDGGSSTGGAATGGAATGGAATGGAATGGAATGGAATGGAETGGGGAGPVCGDGFAEQDEECDGADLDGGTCVSLGFDGGTLECSNDCTYDTTSCTTITCGDGMINDVMEQCDGADLGMATCISEGFTGGTLVCGMNCQLDTSGCGTETCTDGADDDFDMLADCADMDCAAACADSCASPVVLADPSIDVAGNTTGHADLYDDGCFTTSGGDGEVTYQITVATTGMLDVTLVSPMVDLGLSLWTSCGANAITCRDEAFPGNMADPDTEELSIPVDAGDVVFITVEGFGTAEGAFTLSAESRPIVCGDGLVEGTESCDDGDMNDMNGCTNACVFNCPALACADGNLCTTDTCTPQAGCLFGPIDPNDNNACTTDSCNPATGVSNAPITCQDNNACTTNGCAPASGCTFTPISPNDNNACTVDTCNPASGVSNVLPTQPHDKCTTGAANQPFVNTPGCTTATNGNQGIISAVCAADAFCCANDWDNLCVGRVFSNGNSKVCAASNGNCAHTVCTTGAALAANCDSAFGDCVDQICAVDPFCCGATGGTWDSICVGRVATTCMLNCN